MLRMRARRPPEETSVLNPEESTASAGRAEKYVLDLLSRCPRTVMDVAMRLRARGYSENVIDALLLRMRSAGYLDDRRFALSWVEERSQSKPCGAARLRRELSLKGIPPKVVSDVLGEAVTIEVERELATQAARKKTGPNGPRSESETRRLWDFLRRRGFRSEACRAAMVAVALVSPDEIDE